jgi:hypothetical protein
LVREPLTDEARSLDDPTTVALLAAEAFERARWKHAVYGGLLTAAYGEPRETRDADFAVVDMKVQDAARALQAAGVETQVSFEEVRFGGLSLSRLALLGSATFTGLNTIDLVRPLSGRYAKDSLARALTSTLRGRAVRVLAPEDFLIYKALSTRDRDLDDGASALRRSRELLDLDWLGREIEMLAAEIPDFDAAARYAAMEERAGRRRDRP